MLNKKIILLAIFLVRIFAISAVSAAENATDDIVGISDDNAIGVDDNQDSLNSAEADVLEVDSSYEGQLLQSSISDTAEVCSASEDSKITEDALGAVNPNSSQAEPVLKAKKLITVKMNVKYKYTTKKVGKYKIHARLWRVCFMGGYVNYLDIELYKNGKMLGCSKYLSKYQYKDNGRWKWWPKWRHGGVNHSYHRYINDRPIKALKVAFYY